MIITNYGELQAEIVDRLDEDPGTAKVQSFICLTEAELRRRLTDLELESRQTTQIGTAGTDADEFVGLPGDFGGLKVAYLVDSTTAPARRQPLHYRTPQELMRLCFTVKDEPQYITIQDNQFRLAPIPDKERTLEVVYRRKLNALSDTTPTNWLLTQHPDIYLFGSLANGADYIFDNDLLTKWEARFERGLAQLIEDDMERQFGDQVLQVTPHRVAGANA